MRVAGTVLLVLLALAAGFVAGRLSVGFRPLVHYSKAPLWIGSPTGESTCALPSGTALYVDSEPFPEGFSRYRVYVNIDGRPLEARPTERLWEISPLTGFFDPGE